MATFGQGINPQLGAIDYSPILRGSLAGAQMAAQGSQMIGQSLANLGEEAGKAVQKYYYNKDTKEMLGGVTKRIAGILDKDPYIANRLGLRKDPKTNTWDEKAIAVAVTNIGGGDVRKGVQMTNGFLSDRASQLVENSAFINATAPGVYMPGRQAAAYASLGGNNPMAFDQYLQAKAQAEAQRRLADSQATLALATANARASETGKDQEVRNATVAVGKALERLRDKDGNIVFAGGLRKEDLGNLSPEGVVLANKLFTEAATNQASLNSILKSTERVTAFAKESLEATVNPVISVINGAKYLRMPTPGGGYSFTPIVETDEEKIAEHSKATKKILDDYFAAKATPAAKFVASAALFKLNPYLAQNGGVYLIDDLLKNANPNYVNPPPVFPETGGGTTIKSITQVRNPGIPEGD